MVVIVVVVVDLVDGGVRWQVTGNRMCGWSLVWFDWLVTRWICEGCCLLDVVTVACSSVTAG